MDTSVILSTIFISLGALIIGGAAGGGLGILMAIGIRTLFTAIPPLYRLTILVPWRTIVLNLLIITWMPISVVLIGLRPRSGLVNTSLEIFLLALLFIISILLEQWYPSPLALRAVAGLRTLATTSLTVAAFLSDFYGIGWHITMSMVSGRYDEFCKDWLVLAALILILDILLGVIQLGVANHIATKTHAQSDA